MRRFVSLVFCLLLALPAVAELVELAADLAAAALRSPGEAAEHARDALHQHAHDRGGQDEPVEELAAEGGDAGGEGHDHDVRYVRKKSSNTMATAEATTEALTARPTPGEPPRTERPK